MKSWNKPLWAILAILAFAGCTTAEFHHPQIDVHGMVYDFDNRPVAGYAVTLGGRYTAVTDAMGRYVFLSVPEGTYALIGSRAGYERYETETAINSRTDIQYLRVASAEELIELADDRLARGDLEAASLYVSRAERTLSRSSVIPYYAAVISFRAGKTEDALRILSSLEDFGCRDANVLKTKSDMLATLGEVPDAAR